VQNSLNSPSRLNPLEADILRTILYFDIFSFPPTFDEVYHFLPQNSTSAELVKDTCQGARLRSILRHQGEFVQLASRPNFTAQRLDREQRAAPELRRARLVARGLQFVPFIRGVFLSGELSKGLASPHSDIDFVVVTAEGRLWFVRSVLAVLKRLFFFGSKRFFCLNYFVARQHLEHSERNQFTAIEIATLRPLIGFSVFNEYSRANQWIKDFLPNSLKVSRPQFDLDQTSKFQHLAESLLDLFLSDRFDQRLMNLWKWVWMRRYPELSDEQRERQFRSLPYLSTAYGSDQMNRILEAYQARIAEHHLSSN